MAQPNGLTASIAELFAILGVDDTPLNEGLRRAEIRMEDSARKQVISVKSIADIYKKFPADVLEPIIRGYAQMGRTAAQANQDIMAGLSLLDEQKRKVQALTAAQAANRQETIAIQQIQRRLDESRAAAQEAYRAADRRETIEIQGIRKRLNDEIIKQQELEKRSVVLQPGGGGSSFMFQHIAAYTALFGAIGFAREALSRPLQIQREAAQTGFGVEGVQRLQYAAAATGTPIEMATGSIARLQERVSSMEPQTRKALQNLGLDADNFRKRLETGPIEAVTLLAQRIDALRDSRRQAAIFDLFGGRTGEVSALISELATGMEEGAILTDKQTEAVARLAREYAKLKLEALSYFAMFVGDVLDRSKAGATSVTAALGSSLTVAGAVAGASLGIRAPGPFPFKIGGAIVGAVGGAMAANAGINKIGGVGELPTKPAGPIAAAPAGLPDITISAGEQSAVERSLATQHRQIVQNTRDEQREVRGILSALNDLGMGGLQNAERLKTSFDTIKEATKEGIVTVDELRQATAAYFEMLEEQARGPALKEAIQQFERGFLSERGLLKARERFHAQDALSEAEGAFQRGEIGPQDLRRIFKDYQSVQSRIAGPKSSIMDRPRTFEMDTTGEKVIREQRGNTINIIPMDEFSDRMLRNWQRTGTLSR